MISASGRPRSCSRTTYCATRCSLVERWKRSEKRSLSAMVAILASPVPVRSALARPLEVGVRDRVAVRVVRREAERLVDPGLELLRQRVLEAVGLVVHLVHVDPECPREIQLEEP